MTETREFHIGDILSITHDRLVSPDLMEIVVPETINSEETLLTWLIAVEATYGTTRPVARLAAEDHTSIDPVAELKMMRPDMPIIEVEL